MTRLGKYYNTGLKEKKISEEQQQRNIALSFTWGDTFSKAENDLLLKCRCPPYIYILDMTPQQKERAR